METKKSLTAEELSQALSGISDTAKVYVEQGDLEFPFYQKITGVHVICDDDGNATKVFLSLT